MLHLEHITSLSPSCGKDALFRTGLITRVHNIVYSKLLFFLRTGWASPRECLFLEQGRLSPSPQPRHFWNRGGLLLRPCNAFLEQGGSPPPCNPFSEQGGPLPSQLHGGHAKAHGSGVLGFSFACGRWPRAKSNPRTDRS